MSGQVRLERDGAIAHVLFDNPAAYNALTKDMWRALRDISRELSKDSSVRVVTFRGVGGKAFVSGTDISGFASFDSEGQDGVAYERMIDECMGAVDEIPQTTIAIVDGWAIGGGINISSSCDFRIATPNARFGSPIGRTIANCLSMNSCARIAGAVGVQYAKRMVLLGEIISAQQLLDSGFLLKIVEPAELDAAVAELCQRAAENAPLTTRTTKESVFRMTYEGLPEIEGLIAQVYGSNDFRQGVRHFLDKQPMPEWVGD